MQSISRRGFVISAATASAVFGLNKPIEFIGPAFAQKADPGLLEKGFVKFKVGDVEVTQIYDGIWNKAHDPGFIKNASLDDTKGALKAAGLPDDNVPITFTVTVVSIGGKVTMFDAGTGIPGQVQPTAGLLASKNLAAAGIDAAKIENILVTHFHPDHVFGLMDKETGAQKFAGTQIHVPAPEFAFWTGDSLPDAAKGLGGRIKSTIGGWTNVQKVEGEKEVVAGVRSLPTPGHTPGHTSYQIASGNQQLIVLGDVTNIPALNLKNPGWHLAFDGNAALAEQNRRKMFDRVVADKIIVTGYHFGLPGAGTIQKDGGGYALVPVA